MNGILKPLLLLMLAFSLWRCNQSDETGKFVILPSPVTFDVSGSSDIYPDELNTYRLSENVTELPSVAMLKKMSRDSFENSSLRLSIDKSSTRPEAYELLITRNRIDLNAADKAGLFYGLMTLEQLIEDARDQAVTLPLCRITDYPALSYRAVHLDVKHHLERPEYYFRIIDKLSRYKVNAIILEIEDKLAYERRPIVGSSDAFTIDDWKKISEYAKERFIEISPLVQGLGHASFILKHDEYADLRDDPNSDWAFNPLDERTYEVQFDLYLDALEATPFGRYLHVGGDEVHTTGRGSGKSALELQLAWLNRVCQFAEANGRTPIFWDDMPLKHAGVYRSMFNTALTEQEVDSIWEENEYKLTEFLDQFPKNCIYMRWNYSDPQAIGNDRAMEWFRTNGLQVMGATAGQTRWVLMPQNGSNLENIRHFALSSINKNIDGLLCTLWDDDSPHFELYWRGILGFAEYTWAGDRRSASAYKSAYRHREFSHLLADEEYAFIDSLELPVASWNNALLKSQDRRRLIKLKDPLTEAILDIPDPDQKGQWSKNYQNKIRNARKYLQTHQVIDANLDLFLKNANRNQFTLKIYQQVNELARYSSELILALEAYDNANTGSEISEAAQQLEDLSREFIEIRTNLEEVYGQSRQLEKPEDYLLDQDHHRHLANQTKNLDWLFLSEIMFLEKLELALSERHLRSNL